jgi:hypothetical protein
MEVRWGSSPTNTAMSGSVIFNNYNILGGWHIGTGNFTPSITGIYYVGFHGYSDADMSNLCVDDIKIVKVVEATSWTGAVDTDWNILANWSNGLPTSTTNIVIPAGISNFPVVDFTSAIGTIVFE